MIDPALALAVRLGLAALLLAAALHKLRAPEAFRATLAEYRLLPRALVAPAAAGLVAAELGLGAALLAPATAHLALLGSAGLLVLYGAAVAANLARGRRDLDCGCTGPALRQPLSGALVARNALLAALALAARLPAAERTLGALDALTVAGAVATAAALYAASSRLLAEAPRSAALRSAG